MVDQNDVRVIISMMIICTANVIIEYGRRTSGLPSAPLDMDMTTIEQYREIAP